MMNQETWSKSLLASYRILPKIVKSIDSYTMSLALGSFSYAGNTLDLMQKIIDNNKRKEALINAKVIVDNTLQDLKPKYREVLELKYLKNLPVGITPPFSPSFGHKFRPAVICAKKSPPNRKISHIYLLTMYKF